MRRATPQRLRKTRPLVLAARRAAGRFGGRHLRAAQASHLSGWNPMLLRWARRLRAGDAAKPHRGAGVSVQSHFHWHLALTTWFRTMSAAQRGASASASAVGASIAAPRGHAVSSRVSAGRHGLFFASVGGAAMRPATLAPVLPPRAYPRRGSGNSRAAEARIANVLAVPRNSFLRRQEIGGAPVPGLAPRPSSARHLLERARAGVASRTSGSHRVRASSRASAQWSLSSMARAATPVAMRRSKHLAASHESTGQASRAAIGTPRIWRNTPPAASVRQAATTRAARAATLLAQQRPLDLAWRSADSKASSAGGDSRAAATFTRGEPVRMSEAAPVPSPPVGRHPEQTIVRANALDPALVNRLADDVIRRIDRRARIERERRGLL